MRLYRLADDEDLDVLRQEYLQYAQRDAEAFDQLNARRLELEEVRPDSQLSRVHEEAVKFFRCTLELRNAEAERNFAMLAGNFAEAQKADKKAYDLQVICNRVDDKLVAALRQVQRNNPTLLAALGFPADEGE